MHKFSLTTLDAQIRSAAFAWLTQSVDTIGELLPRTILQKGFLFQDERIPLVSPQGIFKPRQLEIPLSITTAPKGPYSDGYDKRSGYLQYKYRDSGPEHRDNQGLRLAMKDQTPLIYFHGIVPGKYMAFWPVFIVFDDLNNSLFHVALDDLSSSQFDLHSETTTLVADHASESRRKYITATVRKRLHQRSFRERVIRAYREQCSLCRLRHLELLDAAHIIPDSAAEGEPIVNNGIALCKLHHAAYDSFIIGITPDYTIDIRADILEEEDGPMLQHGLKELHATRIILPKSRQNWPDQQLLEKRYTEFKKVG